MPLIRARELASAAFVRDLGAFFAHGPEVLQAIAEAGDDPDGFFGELQAQSVSSQSEISHNDALSSLAVAAYLYDRVSELGINVDEAILELRSAAEELQPAVPINDETSAAIAAILEFKREYELSRAVSRATSNAPHFISAHGSWGVRPIQMGNEETINVPVVAFTIHWHDGAGNAHETFLQMSHDDWSSFCDEVDTITRRFSDVESLL